MSFDCNEDALSLPISECGDCSAYEARIKSLEETIEAMASAISDLKSADTTLTNSVASLREDIATVSSQKQDKLTVGEGLSLSNTTISVDSNSVALWDDMGTVPVSITAENGRTVTANLLNKE